MSSTRRSFLRAAALTPALAVLTRPLGRFGGDAAAMATHGVEVPSAGLVIDASGLVGVSLSWAPSAGGSSVAPVADVRARTGGTWGRWTPIEPDRGHGPDDPGREHGPPILVPGADAHEISPRPGVTGLRVHPLDGGADAAPFSALTTVSPMPGLDIIERHNWTDRPRKATWDCVLGSSLFGRGCRADVGLRHAIVHHTVNVNDYGQGAVPTLLIGIQRYHMDTRGWDDIAYNFVVDRFARIWQTREADLIEPITGGHTTGLNTESVGVAVLGDFRGHDPGAAVADVIGTLLGWKLSIHGVDPLGTSEVRSSGGDYAEPGDMVTLLNIAGHRDHQITTCPGDQLYGRLGAVRATAAELVPVYGHLTPSYSLHEIGFVGWTVERFRPDDPIEVEVAVDGVTTTVLADADVADSYPAVAAATAHGFSRVVPIDLDTRSITVTAKAADGRTASLMDLVLYAGFIDVEPDRFYADAVYWLRQNDLTTGTRPGLFEPRDFITRGQMAVFLWRFMDEPAASEATPFTDVADESYAAAAVRWLHGAGITTGVTPDTFAPDDFVTRGQMATFLWRLCGRIEPSAPSPFEDLVPGAFYETPVSWLDETGITTGVTPTRFAPDDAITRGEMAVFLMRLATTPEAWTRIEPPSVVAAAPAP